MQLYKSVLAVGKDRSPCSWCHVFVLGIQLPEYQPVNVLVWQLNCQQRKQQGYQAIWLGQPVRVFRMMR